MKRTERVGAMVQILCQNPNKNFSLNYFCDLFQAAKSSISEDVGAAKKAVEYTGLGRIETTAGSKGGIKYVPWISAEATEALLKELKEKLSDKSRILGGGFLYTSDIMFDADLVRRVGEVFAKKFVSSEADYVVTIETKGIPVALMTAHMLNLPMVVIRRESKISEGSTVSINYFSGSTERIQKMSLAKRAVKPGTKAIIIDDFMRAGGSVKGISDMLREFEVEIAGVGVVIASMEPDKKKIQNYFTLLHLGKVDEDSGEIAIMGNEEILT
ncbi:pur operon repressor [Anaerovorax sp. IOR16]|uniref:pur operon repressor n=1 Tax=Anaerovorax sp. IOR16 TaxID=2773458 RepID=UPI0019D10863|nr:pur operon repressor [Anaerovorax sp. IOR16]